MNETLITIKDVAKLLKIEENTVKRLLREDELLELEEVAKDWLKVDIRTIRRYNDLPVIELSPRCFRIRKSDLIKWIEKKKRNI